MEKETLFIGNLPHSATESEIREHFSPAGKVHSIELITDRKGRSRCFGFITIDNPEEAIECFNKKEFQEREIRVARAFPEASPFQRRRGFHRGKR